MTRRSLLAAAAAWLTAAAMAPVAGAAIPGRYASDLRALKKDLRFGDALPFELYTDPGSAGPALHEELLAAGTPEFTVEQVKPLTPKRQRPKATPTARIRATLGVRCPTSPCFSG